MTEVSGSTVVLGYDGSLPAGVAIEVAARLLPAARAYVAYVWAPPFASEPLRRRLWHGTSEINEFVAAIEHQGEAEAERLADMGVSLAGAYGWQAQPLIRRTYGGEGLQLGEIAEEVGADLIVLGSRGLGGARAVLGSVSDMAVHYATRPVLVIPHPLLESERAMFDAGPVVLGWDGSAGAEAARRSVSELFPQRAVVPVFVEDGDGPDGPDISGLMRIPRVDGRLEHGRGIAAALADQARESRAALIVVGSRGRSALSEILLGSVAMATLHHVFRPVLVVPHRGPVAPPTRVLRP
jgi:nucleotide-binding universal stress UspA family protein